MWFFLQMPANDTESKTIVFQVYDFDRFTKNDAVGEVKKLKIDFLIQQINQKLTKRLTKNDAVGAVKLSQKLFF